MTYLLALCTNALGTRGDPKALGKAIDHPSVAETLDKPSDCCHHGPIRDNNIRGLRGQLGAHWTRAREAQRRRSRYKSRVSHSVILQ